MTWPVSPERIARGLYWQEAWKLVEGCTPVSRGCDNCWSARETAVRAKHPNKKISIPKKGLTFRHRDCVKFIGKILLREDNLDKPLRAKKPRVYAVWNDLFHEHVPEVFIEEVFGVMKRVPQHIFLILTKRPERIRDYFEGSDFRCLSKNLWLGVSVEDQKTADERIPLLLQTPAAKRFVSYEPALGPVDFKPYLPKAIPPDHVNGTGYITPGIDWLIMGGESGSGARPMNPEWVRSARDQCQAAGVPFFFKQWGKKAAGCLLDGREWKELPRC